MSFILDALKKSETERQQQSSAEFASVPTSSGDSHPMRWLWLLIALLGINLAVLLGILLRPEVKSAGSVAVDETVIPEPETVAVVLPDDTLVAATPSFADQLAEARRERATRPQTVERVPDEPTEGAPVATSRSTIRASTSDWERPRSSKASMSVGRTVASNLTRTSLSIVS